MKKTPKKFGPVWGASGIQGFFGEQYWYQKYFAKYVPGYSFRGTTFVAKTVTAEHTQGNAPLEEDGVTLKERRPKCIVLGLWQFICGVMLNAVGLSNIGIEALAAKRQWQGITEPFMLSVMATGETRRDRYAAMRKITEQLATLIPTLKAPVAIQLNGSCPNVKTRCCGTSFFFEEMSDFLFLLRPLGMPVYVKINTNAHLYDAFRLAEDPACTGFVVSNTLHWGSIPKWMRILFFGSTTSPLAHLGGGGLSGWPLRRRVCAWIRDARAVGITKHINAGGGIFGPFGVWSVWRAGADSISLGTIATVRPWMLGLTVKFATWLFTTHPRRTS